jgi:hypothetical protein
MMLIYYILFKILKTLYNEINENIYLSDIDQQIFNL